MPLCLHAVFEKEHVARHYCVFLILSQMQRICKVIRNYNILVYALCNIKLAVPRRNCLIAVTFCMQRHSDQNCKWYKSCIYWIHTKRSCASKLSFSRYILEVICNVTGQNLSWIYTLISYIGCINTLLEGFLLIASTGKSSKPVIRLYWKRFVGRIE